MRTDLKHRREQAHASTTTTTSTLSSSSLALQPGHAVPVLANSSTGSVDLSPRRAARRAKYSASPSPIEGISSVAFAAYILILFLCLVGAYFLFTYVETQHDNQIRQEIRQKEIGFLSRDLEKKFEKLEKDNKYLTKRLEDAEMARARAQEELETNQATFEKTKKRVEYLLNYKQQIKEAIQRQDKQMILEKYGPGPFQIEIQLAFHPESNVAEMEGGESIVIETAPIDEMPHSIWLFLEQVDRQLFDGCSFHRNAGHVVQAGPAPNFLTSPGAQLAKRFKTAGLSSVLFQEYSPKVPHEKYTIGYGGRPGGPEFYINLRDNTRDHGPGGQANYEDPTEADPCFAKVISGFEAIDRIHKAEVKDHSYMHMAHNVAIVHMKILGREKS